MLNPEKFNPHNIEGNKEESEGVVEKIMEENINLINKFREDKEAKEVFLHEDSYHNKGAFERLKSHLGIEGSGDEDGCYKTEIPGVILYANENGARSLIRTWGGEKT